MIAYEELQEYYIANQEVFITEVVTAFQKLLENAVNSISNIIKNAEEANATQKQIDYVKYTNNFYTLCDEFELTATTVEYSDPEVGNMHRAFPVSTTNSDIHNTEIMIDIYNNKRSDSTQINQEQVLAISGVPEALSEFYKNNNN